MLVLLALEILTAGLPMPFSRDFLHVDNLGKKNEAHTQ